MTPTSRKLKSGPVDRKSARGLGDLLLGRERAGDPEDGDQHEEAAEEHVEAERRVVEERVGVQASESGAVVARPRREGVQDLGEAVRPLVGERRQSRRQDRGRGAEPQDAERQDEDREHRELDLVRLDLLAEVLGRAADHEPRDEDREDDEQEHAVEAGADAAEDDLSRGDVGERHEAADRREGVVPGVDGAARGVRRDRGEECRVADPEPDLLALHVPAGPAGRREAATPSFWWIGLPRCSAISATTAPTRNRNAIAAKTAHPCRTDPVIRPSVLVSPAPIAKIRTISRKFVPGVGFS